MSDHTDRHDQRNAPPSAPNRRNLLKGLAFGSAAIGSAGAGLFAGVDPHTGKLGLQQAHAATPARSSMAFIQWQPHTVPAAWSKGIEEVLKTQQVIDYCAARNIKADIELIAPEDINQAFDRVVKKDVRYRFVIDLARGR